MPIIAVQSSNCTVTLNRCKLSIHDGKASPLVRYSVLNVLYAYAFTVRLYNGEHRDLPVDAAQVLYQSNTV